MYTVNQCNPTREQMWLLQVALLEGAAAQQAWKQWRIHVDLNEIDLASYHLLPLIYHRLTGLKVDDEWLGRLRGVYRHSWSKNQLLFHHVQEVVARLDAAGIRAMALHGAAMAAGYYQTAGTRLMTAADLLVPHAQLLEAVAQLRADGWQFDIGSQDDLQWLHRHRLRSRVSCHKGHAELNIHVRLLPLVEQDEARYWSTARCHRWHGAPLYLLDPTHQLFHTCVQGMTWSSGYLTWIVDAMAILSAVQETDANGTMDWQALLQLASETRKILPITNALLFLQAAFQAPVPSALLEQLVAMPVTFAEQQEYRLLGTANLSRRERILQLMLAASRYQTRHQPSATPVCLSFTAWIPYLFYQWQLDHWWQWPTQLVRKLVAVWQRHRLSAEGV